MGVGSVFFAHQLVRTMTTSSLDAPTLIGSDNRLLSDVMLTLQRTIFIECLTSYKVCMMGHS